MGKEYLRGWFRVTVSDKPLLLYITSAYDLSDARRNFGFHCQGRIVEQLKWRDLHNLTGCPIPNTATPDDLAVGDLMITYKSQTVVICNKV